MKTVVLLITSELLLILAAVFLFSGWKGVASFNFGWPLTQFIVNINGGANGGWVAMAVALLLLAVVTLIAGLVSAMRNPALKTNA